MYVPGTKEKMNPENKKIFTLFCIFFPDHPKSWIKKENAAINPTQPTFFSFARVARSLKPKLKVSTNPITNFMCNSLLTLPERFPPQKKTTLHDPPGNPALLLPPPFLFLPFSADRKKTLFFISTPSPQFCSHPRRKRFFLATCEIFSPFLVFFNAFSLSLSLFSAFLMMMQKKG